MKKPLKHGRRLNPIVHLFSKTWQYSKGERKKIVFYWFLFIMANSTALVLSPFIMAKIMNVIQHESVSQDNIWMILGLLTVNIFTTIIFWSFHGPGRLIERGNAFKVRANYRKSLVKGVLGLPLGWHSEHHSGNTIDKIEKGSLGLYAFAAESFQPILFAVRLIVSYALLIYFSPPAGIIVLFALGTAVIIVMKFEKVTMANYKELNSFDNCIATSIFDTVSNITTVIILRVEKLVFEGISHKIDEPFDLFKKNNRLIEFKWFLISLSNSIMTAVVLGVYFLQHLNSGEKILFGSVFLLIRYLDEMSNNVSRFTEIYTSVLERQGRVLNAEVLSNDFETENLTNHVLPEKWKKIEIRKLNFSYQDEQDGKLNLKDISLSIGRGEKIALVGESGSGKTTLLKIVRDLYSPESLELYVDGKNIPDGFAGISRAISLIPQRPEIFATTIKENITLGAEYSPDDIKHFINLACFSGVVEELPKGLDTSINEKGVKLSIGQNQRLALSRGLLASADKSLILLDEPTASIDPPTELRIYENIIVHFKHASIISSIHRHDLFHLFDRLYLFDKGQIIASGGYYQLMSNCPKFQELCRKSKSKISE